MASFTFDDGSGDQILRCGYPAPANRFRDWTPDPAYIGERAVALDRKRYQYVLATAERASLMLPGIALADEQILRAWLKHAKAGGTFTVTTDDAESNTYDDCQLASDDHGNPLDPEVRLNPLLMTYEVSCVIEHVGSPQRALRCVYFARPSTTMAATAGSFTLAGTDVNSAGNLLTADDGTFTLTGAAANTVANLLVADDGAFTLTGAAADLTVS